MVTPDKGETSKKKRRPRGPAPERLKIKAPWEQALKTALEKSPPKRNRDSDSPDESPDQDPS